MDNFPRPSEGADDMSDLISREKLLNEIDLLKKSPWYNNDFAAVKLVRKDAVAIVEKCVEEATTEPIPAVQTCVSEDKIKIKAIEQLNEIPKLYGNDNEAAHIRADEIIIQFLNDIGYAVVAKAWENAEEEVGFWYA